MRPDAFGILWEDHPVDKTTKQGREARVRPQPPIPENGWTPPTSFPNLFHAKVLGIDTETRDPHLLTHGPGWGRDDGEIVGVSLSTDDGYKCYLPMRHTVQKELNLDPVQVARYLRDLLGKPMPKVGANLVYDLGWLQEEDIQVAGKLYDVLYAEAILYDTAKSYSLNSVAARWLGEQKEDDVLYAWAAAAYGGKAVRKQAGNIYRCPPSLVGPYAEMDADLPVRILPKQWEQLVKHNLLGVFQLECRLIPVLLGMRRRGVPVDIERAEEVGKYLLKKEETAQTALNDEAGFDVGVYTNADIQRLFDNKGVKYPKTPKGAPSFTKDWLGAHPHPMAAMINTVRKYNKARGTFIENAIMDKHVNGTVYPSLHPLRSDDGGAVSGRFSSSNPNSQQIPARDKELGPLIRSIFIPEKGFDQWIKQDLSQIEYRLFAHYSGDTRLIAEYQNKHTDYHNVVSGFLGHLMPRGTVKNFNFMSLYGGGKGKVVHMLKSQFDKEQVEKLLIELIHEIPKGNIYSNLAEVFITLYNTNFPAAKESLERDLLIAERHGEIRTILNRRSTFDLYEPIHRHKQPAYPRTKAEQVYGSYIKRAFCFRALNRRLQGSAADLLKKGMVDAYEQGVFDIIGFPHVTVHDELDNSFHPDLAHGFQRLKQCVEQAIPTNVPIIMDAEVGPNWGHVKKFDLT